MKNKNSLILGIVLYLILTARGMYLATIPDWDKLFIDRCVQDLWAGTTVITILIALYYLIKDKVFG